MRNVHFSKTTKPKSWTQVFILDVLPKPGCFWRVVLTVVACFMHITVEQLPAPVSAGISAHTRELEVAMPPGLCKHGGVETPRSF